MLCSRSRSYNSGSLYLPFLFAYFCLYQLVPLECHRKYSEGAEPLKDDRGLVQISPGCSFTYGKIKNTNIKSCSFVPSHAQHRSLRVFLCSHCHTPCQVFAFPLTAVTKSWSAHPSHAVNLWHCAHLLETPPPSST